MNIDTGKGRVQSSETAEVKALRERLQVLEARLEKAEGRLPPEKPVPQGKPNA